MSKQPPSAPLDVTHEALVRTLVARIGDKWTLRVIGALREHGELRFSQLQARVDGISHRLLTKTLRDLENYRLVTRHAHAVVPPRVHYRLTTLGVGLA